MLKSLCFSLASLLLATTVLVSCTKDKENNNSNCTDTKSWTNDVSPIIQSSCALAGCHAAGESNGPGALTTYQQVFTNRFSIRQAVANGTMPKTGSLTETQKNAIICWIDSNAPQN